LTGLFSCHKIELGIDYYKHRLRFSSYEKTCQKRPIYFADGHQKLSENSIVFLGHFGRFGRFGHFGHFGRFGRFGHNLVTLGHT